MNEALEHARKLIADALNLGEGSVGDDAAIGTLEGWDSLGHMRLIVAIEETLGRQIPAETLVEISSLADVADILEKR